MIARVTIIKDRDTRRSKGVAFVLFLQRDSAHQAVHALNNTQVSWASMMEIDVVS